MRYHVFHSDHSDDKARPALGSFFRIYNATPHSLEFDEEYALLTRDEPPRVCFYQQGQTFEFCGAGALCIAHYLNTKKSLNSPVTIQHSSHNFSVLRIQPPSDWPKKDNINIDWAVAVQLGNIPCTHVQKFNNLNCNFIFFKNHNVGVFCVNSLAAVKHFSPVYEAFGHNVQTVIAIYIDNNKQLICFRYFTQFNSKGEDQATGSVFRYLSALPIKKHTWYRVNQVSQAGAAMVCYLDDDYTLYSGNVERID